MVGALSLGCMTGCGKSDEQKAQEEIAQHLREEAAADGVDLDKEVADEMAAYEEKHEAFEADQAQKASSKEEIEEKYFDYLDEAFYQYENAESSPYIEDNAHIYNDLYAEMIAECESAGITLSYKHSPAYRDEYLAKTAFCDVAKVKANSDTEMWVYSNRHQLSGEDSKNPENYNSVMCLVDHDSNGNISKVTIVKNGTNVVELNVADYGIVAPFEVYEVNETGIIFNAMANGDYFRYQFDFSGNCQLVKDSNTSDYFEIELENPWYGTWDLPNEDGLKSVLSNL